MRRVALAAAALSILALEPGPARAATGPKGVVGPVAVLPFKNLNRDRKLDWLSVGIAETMVSDVKRSGAVEVVERDQIDRALAQIALEGEVKLAPSTAVKVGRIVGARTIVLGAYQEAGSRIRITARFVSVETGVVEDAAKVTGPLTRIFHLQDAIVARLVGVRHGHRYRPPKREKGSARTVSAYRLYAMSLQVASDATRVSYLKRAVKVDPHFHYAVAALAALATRMRGYAARDQAVTARRMDRRRQALRAGTASPSALFGDAIALLLEDETARDFHQYLRDVDLVAHSKVPERFGPMHRDQMVLADRVLAYERLHRFDLGLQYGEAYLKRYPGSMFYATVEGLMKQMIRARKLVEQERLWLDHALARIARQRAGAGPRDPDPARRARALAGLDVAKCTAYQTAMQYRKTIAVCAKVIAAHRAPGDPISRAQLLDAYYAEANAEATLARYRAAWRTITEAEKRFPGSAEKFSDIVEDLPARRSP